MKPVRPGVLLDVLGVTINVARRELRARFERPLVATVTVERPRHEVHACYRRLHQQLASCLDTSPRRVDFEILEDRPGEVLVWRSRRGNGRATFTPVLGREATEVRVVLAIGPLARWLVAPQIRGDLLRLKHALESTPAATPRRSSAVRSPGLAARATATYDRAPLAARRRAMS